MLKFLIALSISLLLSNSNLVANQKAAQVAIDQAIQNGATVIIPNGTSRTVGDQTTTFEDLPITGPLILSVDGQSTTIADQGYLTLDGQDYQVHGWGINRRSWLALTPQTGVTENDSSSTR